MIIADQYKEAGHSLKPPWSLYTKDMNLDGVFSISDILEWLVHTIFFVGDSIQYLIYKSNPKLANFLEIGWDSYHGWFSGVIGIPLTISIIVLMFFLPEYFEKNEKYLIRTVLVGFIIFGLMILPTNIIAGFITTGVSGLFLFRSLKDSKTADKKSKENNHWVDK